VARTPRTFSGGGHAKAKAGENTEQNQRDGVTEKLMQALCVGRWAAVWYVVRALWRHSSVGRLLAARRGLFLGVATNPANIIPLSRSHTITTGFQGTRMYMRVTPGRSGPSLLLPTRSTQ